MTVNETVKKKNEQYINTMRALYNVYKCPIAKTNGKGFKPKVLM